MLDCISNFVDDFLKFSVEKNASDIHCELFDDDFFIKFRINGELQTIYTFNKYIAAKIFSRIKVLANINIAEKRFPQDGCIRQVIDDIDIEFRVSTTPIVGGESVVIRVLNSQKSFEIAQHQLMCDEKFLKLLEHIKKNNGLSVVAGTTGSGKTTTLYAILSYLNTDDVKIVTCEDPVEYELKNVSQSNINSAVGFTFETALKAFLRHDPDIILVGEIRDKETAELAVRAAITGHKVFTTIHANGLAGVVPRLIDFGVDKNVLSEAISTISSQQLIKIKNETNETIGRKAQLETLIANTTFRKSIRD